MPPICLWMLKGEKPSADAAQLIDRDLVLHAEHGSNASSFTARVVIGTEANLHAAITAAIAALSGPAHGGAAEDVMKMAEEIGDPSRAADYVRDKRKAGEAVTGFGHRVYRAEDPRARHMRAGVERLSREMGQPRWYEILQAVVRRWRPMRGTASTSTSISIPASSITCSASSAICSFRSSPSGGCPDGCCKCSSSRRTTS